MDAANRERKALMLWRDSEDMGESTLPQRIQLEEMVLKGKDDGKEMETDNGVPAELFHLSCFFLTPSPTQFVHEVCIEPSWKQVMVAFQPETGTASSSSLFFH